MSLSKIRKLGSAVVVVGLLLAASATTAKATIYCTPQRGGGSYSGNTIFCYDFNSHSSSGDYWNSYNCNLTGGYSGGFGNFFGSYGFGGFGNNFNFHNHNYHNNYYSYSCSIQFNNFHYGTQCQNHQGNCSIVFDCGNGQTYSCDIHNWNGYDEIYCKNLPKDCNDVKILCHPQCSPQTPPTCVPEPSTIIAGALLLLPLGLSSVRILRRNKNLPTA